MIMNTTLFGKYGEKYDFIRKKINGVNTGVFVDYLRLPSIYSVFQFKKT
jgi:hypothetical protein